MVVLAVVTRWVVWGWVSQGKQLDKMVQWTGAVGQGSRKRRKSWSWLRVAPITAVAVVEGRGCLYR